MALIPTRCTGFCRRKSATIDALAMCQSTSQRHIDVRKHIRSAGIGNFDMLAYINISAQCVGTYR
jgi:hypothetical protein